MDCYISGTYGVLWPSWVLIAMNPRTYFRCTYNIYCNMCASYVPDRNLCRNVETMPSVDMCILYACAPSYDELMGKRNGERARKDGREGRRGLVHILGGTNRQPQNVRPGDQRKIYNYAIAAGGYTVPGLQWRYVRVC